MCEMSVVYSQLLTCFGVLVKACKDDVMDEKDAFFELLKHPLTLIVCASVVVAVLYHLMSPYRECLRIYQEIGNSRSQETCIKMTDR